MSDHDPTASGGPDKSQNQPALDHKLREVIGARLRSEHGSVVDEPLPLRILYLLGVLGRAHDGGATEK